MKPFSQALVAHFAAALSAILSSCASTSNVQNYGDEVMSPALQKKWPELQACYLKHGKGLVRAKVLFTVMPAALGSGPDALASISDVSIDATEKSNTTPKLESCLIRTIRSVQFKDTGNGKTVEAYYDIRFSPTQGEFQLGGSQTVNYR